MSELFRDTAFGHIARLVTGKKVFLYGEEKDPSLWKKYVNEEASGYVAHHGTTEPPEDPDIEDTGLGGVRTRDAASEKENDVGSPTSSRSSATEKQDVPEGVNMPSGVKVDPENGRDLYVVDWYGDNDPENPVNWSTTKKVFVTFEICLLTFSVYIGSAIYSGGTEDVMQVFGVSQVAATLGLTLFVFGYGLGPMIWSPLSEIPQVGRNPVYIGTLLVFVLLQLAVGYAVNFGMLLAFRFITGFIGSPVLATGGASLADIYIPRKRAYAIGIWGIAAVCGPVMGPVIGNWAAMFKGWTWPIWELAWLSGFAFIFLFFMLPETSANNILYRRARRLRKVTGNDKLMAKSELIEMTPKDIAMMVLVRPITLNFTEPMVLLLNLYIALIYGLLYIWFESFVIVFVDTYGFNLGEEGLAYIGILVGGIITIPPFFWYLHKYVEPKFNEKGEITPEERLVPAFVGGPCIVICLFWFGWSAGNVHWIMPIIGSAWFTVGAFLLFQAVLNYLPDAYPEVAASVLAGNDFMRSSFGGAFPLFASAMFTKLGVDWASSLLGFLALLFVPIPFVLYKYGALLRNKYSKHARKDDDYQSTK